MLIKGYQTENEVAVKKIKVPDEVLPTVSEGLEQRFDYALGRLNQSCWRLEHLLLNLCSLYPCNHTLTEP